MAAFGLPIPTHLFMSPRRLLSQSQGASSVGRFSKLVQCKAVSKHFDQPIARRLANYHPSIWEYDYVQSLNSDYEGENHTRRASWLKKHVGRMLDKVEDSPLYKLELIDLVQRLGVSYQFEVEIKRILETIYYNNYRTTDRCNKEDLYTAALKFRLLRQHGYDVPQEVFNSFKDESGNFKACLCVDTKGMLSLYEASYLSVSSESILDEARNFTSKHLKENLKTQNLDQNLGILVSHALEIPLHWRMPRLEARWFIDVYEKRHDKNITLLEFAKLDFNVVQATHQGDLKHVSRWWKTTRLGEKLHFVRDRLVENFFWTVGFNFEPQFQYYRRMTTKVNSIITIIDDVYDVYGTLEELALFTNAVERWEVDAMEQLPDYMKICFLTLFNSVNEMGYDTLLEQGFNFIPYLKKSWVDICNSYLLEAKWYNTGYIPTLEEYMNNAWISISAPVILVHAYSFVTNPITKDALDCLETYPNIIRWSSMILRLADDLGTSQDEMERGDNPKSIQCYMHETGSSKEDAREHIKNLICETWKKMNEDRVAKSPFNHIFIRIALNVARMAQCMYQHGDGHGIADKETKDRVSMLFIEPIPLNIDR